MRAIKTTTISILTLGLLAGSAFGVSAQDDAAEITTFTGTFSMDGEPLPIETTDDALPNGLIEGNPGFAWLNRAESSDPRFTGDHAVIANWVLGPDGFDAWETGGEPNMIMENVHTVTNEEGSWVGEGRSFSSTELGLNTGDVVAFVGQGGYEGLTAYVLMELESFSGVILPAAMPEVPEPYVAE